MVLVCIFAIVVSAFLHPSLQSENETEGFIYKSSYSMQLLLQSEENLVKEMKDVISSYGNQTNELTKRLNRYVERYEKTLNTMKDISEILAHPINAFHFFKNVVLDWLPVANLYEDKDNQEYVEIIDKMKKFREEAQYPCLNDVNSVAISICSMQKTYDLNVEDLVVGNIRDETTNRVFKSFHPMNSWDCLVFGRAAQSKGWLNTAIDWMEAAKILAEKGDTSIEMTKIQENLKKTVYNHDSILLQYGPKGPQWETYTTPIDEELMKQRKNQFGSPVPEFRPILYAYKPKAEMQEHRNRLCQGQQMREPHLDDKLVCRYLNNNNPYLLIGPFKIEEKCNDPAIIMFHNFMYDSETNQIKKLGGNNLEDSTSVYLDKNLTQAGLNRVSRHSHINYATSPELVAHISRRVEAATNLLSADSKTVYRPLKVINYGIAGHYETHKDYYQHPNVPNEENRLIKPDGDRIATFLIYLNEVEAGGATVFPPIGVTAWPVKGSALFWHNLHKSGVPDEFTLHSGCPVLYGEKWIMTQWPVTDHQIFKAPCGLHECDKHPLLR